MSGQETGEKGWQAAEKGYFRQDTFPLKEHDDKGRLDSLEGEKAWRRCTMRLENVGRIKRSRCGTKVMQDVTRYESLSDMR